MSFSNDMFVFQNEDELQIIVSTIECKKAFYKISCTWSQDAHTVRGDEKISIVKQKRKKNVASSSSQSNFVYEENFIWFISNNKWRNLRKYSYRWKWYFSFLEITQNREWDGYERIK